MKTEDVLMPRKKAFLDAVLRLSQDIPKPLAAFVEDAGFQLVDQQPKAGGSPNHLTERQVKYAVSEISQHILPLEVIYETGNIVLRLGEETAFMRRCKRAKATKQELAKALWEFLLGPSWKGRKSPISLTKAEERRTDLIADKLHTLRRRNQLYFAVDAGSTTLEVINEFLTADRIPFEVRIDGDGKYTDKKENLRIIEPVLLTNSFPIIQAVVANNRHRSSLIVEMIGGTLRDGRNCTTGDLTNLWLKVCCVDGRFGILDLTIVGVTGVLVGPDGVPMVACDDQGEAALKSKLLDMAGGYGKGRHAGGLRVLIFHAAKLLYPEARCHFAAITKEMVDLVVVDRGETPADEKAILELIDRIEQCGVSVLLVPNPGSV